MIKNLRLLLVVVLTLLVPFRGAVAAAMLCPPTSAAPSVDEHAGHAQHHGGDAQPDDGSAERCHLCAAFCSMTPLLNSWPAVLPALAMAPASFPEVGAAALHFLADGQERPPRSC